MKHIIKYILTSFVAILFMTCNRSNTSSVLKNAESVMKEQPDSALTLLKSIDPPQEGDEPNYSNYQLLMVQARDKNYLNISGDILLIKAGEYFAEKNDFQKAAFAYFYVQRILRNQEHYDKAMKQLLVSREYALKVNDYNLLGLLYSDLGLIYLDKFDAKEARKNDLIAQKYFAKAGNKKNEIYILNHIGSSYLTENPAQADSALVYYNKALIYANEQNDNYISAEILMNMGVALFKSGKYTQSKAFIMQSIEKDKNRDFIFYNYRTLSDIFILTHQIDSALFYAKQVPNFDKIIENQNSNFSYHSLLCKIHTAQGDYQSAMKEQEQMLKIASEIYFDREKQSVMEIQKKYDDEKLKTALQQATIRQQYLILIITISILVIISILMFYKDKTAKKNQQIAQVEHNVEVLNGMLFNHNDQGSKFRKLLMEKLDIAKKVVQLNIIPAKNKQQLQEKYVKVFQKDFQNALDWNFIQPIINELYPEFIDKLMKQAPDLAEKEAQLCCLIRAGFRTDEIALLMSFKYKSVSVYKSSVRDKMNFNSYDEFINFLMNL